MKRITFTAPRTVELMEHSPHVEPLGSKQIAGSTLVSLTSPGTELNYHYLGTQFPGHPGYACVFRVEELGEEVEGFKLGDIVYSSGGHADYQRAEAVAAIKLPTGLTPEQAVFARLAGVSMSTVNTTAARPPARALVTGLGPVGNLAAQVLHACGYNVTAVDPVEARRTLALAQGLQDVRSSVADAPADLRDHVQLHIECSGHEQAVLDGCRVVARCGECVLVGVPWRRRTEVYAQELLDAVFHRYIILRSGWEWQVPRQPAEYQGNSIIENLRAAMGWLADGRLNVSGMAGLYSPTNAQAVYDGLYHQTLESPAALFDWRE